MVEGKRIIMAGDAHTSMLIKDGNLTIRDVSLEDAEALCRWWNDGRLMAHVGFPHGLRITLEKVRQELTAPDRPFHLMILEVDGIPVGEINYRDKGNRVAVIGIKVCELDKQGKGYGPRFLTMLMNSLVTDFHFQKITLDTLGSNHRAQHVYEKLGFRKVRVSPDAWKNQLGELESTIDYEILASELARKR